MNLKKRIYIYIITALMICITLSGCAAGDNLKVKLGLKNTDFEYIKQNKINKIIIQSTRDPGFRFMVTDQNAISELYNILSSAKQASEKSTLDADYVFELYEAEGTIHKFKYVAELDRSEGGNLYSDDKTYVVSKRIDNDIINNFWDIRKPKNFQDVYYSSIIDSIDKYFADKDKNKSIGVDLKDDVDIAKFLLSTDLENFKDDLHKEFKTSEIASDDNDKYDVMVTVKTQGYKSTMYKSIITFWDKEKQTEDKYYISGKHEGGTWNVNITSTKPDDF